MTGSVKNKMNFIKYYLYLHFYENALKIMFCTIIPKTTITKIMFFFSCNYKIYFQKTTH